MWAWFGASVIVRTGTANRKIKLVAYRVHTNNGNRHQVSPGARRRCTVTMKLRPVKIDENPEMTMPMRTWVTL